MKQVNLDEPLSDQDKRWLRNINMGHLVDESEARFASTPDDDESTKVFDDDYDSWKVKELTDEAATRNPPVEVPSGAKKADVIALLRAWDQANPE